MGINFVLCSLLKQNKIMVEDSVIYTDGHGVKVTTSQFVVGSSEYLVEGISSVRVYLKRAHRITAVLLCLIGLALIVTGLAHLYNSVQMEPFYIGDYMITANHLAIIIGLVLMVPGIIWLSVIHDRYALHITTAEGEKEPLVSDKRDYIRQVASALYKARGGTADFRTDLMV
jgi:hypothetical protein